jgi:hypothetical protein
MTLLRTYASLLGGEIVSRNILFPPPGHSKHDRSASVRFDPTAPGGFIVHSFAGDDPIPIRDYVQGRLLFISNGGPPPALPSPKRERNEAGRTEMALGIWADAYDPRGTPVQAYLRYRCLDLPDEAAGEAIRFHPACPFAGTRTPAMVCLVRDVVTNEPKAIHRTALSPDGRKATVKGHDRLSLGPIGGGAIKLTPDPDVTTCLGIGEGLESTLSLQLAHEFGPSPVWSLLSAGGIGGFPLLSGIECLWVAVDHDPAGLRAAATLSGRWSKAGRELFLVKPRTERLDLNDTIKGGRRYA